VEIRRAEIVDIPLLHQVFEASVKGLCNKDYTPEQIEAWVSRADLSRWRELFGSSLQFWLAADGESGIPAGFMSVNDTGYLHSMFVHPDYKRKGIATRLLNHAEMLASCFRVASLYAEVSLTARPFFETQGYKVEREQDVFVNGTSLRNFVMRKSLGCCNSL